MRFWGLEPSFSGVSSTKSGFLCAFWLRNPHFRAFRAQNRGFCALFASEALVFGHFEHKIGIFVLGKRDKWHREGERGRSCKTKSSEGQTTTTPGPATSAPRNRQPAPRGVDNQHPGADNHHPGAGNQRPDRGAGKEVPDKRQPAPSRRGGAPSALRLQL